MSEDGALISSAGGDRPDLFAPGTAPAPLPLAGDIERAELIEFLRATVTQAVRERSFCGLLLVAVDRLEIIGECHGPNVAEQTIYAVAERLRARMRGGDRLVRISAAGFALVLNNCSPNDLEQAAGRFLTAVHGDAIETSAGAITVTVTIGGVTSPRPAATAEEALNGALAMLDAATVAQPGSLRICKPIERANHARLNPVATSDRV